MLLVVDANVLFSALIAHGKTREMLYSDRLILMAPEYIFTEIEAHLDTITERSGLSKQELMIAISLIKERIDVIPKDDFDDHLKEANVICPDPDDTEYQALAISQDAMVWSDDKKLKEQNRVISTSELISEMERFTPGASCKT